MAEVVPVVVVVVGSDLCLLRVIREYRGGRHPLWKSFSGGSVRGVRESG